MVRLVLNGERVAAEEKLLSDLKQPVRDIRLGPHGEVYVLTRTGSLLKLTPKK